MKIFNTSYAEFLKKSLNMHTSQNQAISENIDNINTIGFQQKNTDFSELLPEVMKKQRLNTSNDKHLTRLHYKESWYGEINTGKVNLTDEMSSLAVNQIKHDFNVRVIRRMYDGIRAAIKGQTK